MREGDAMRCASPKLRECDGKSPGATAVQWVEQVSGGAGKADVTKLACRSDDRSLAQQAKG